MNCLGAYKKRLEWKHKTEPSLLDRQDDNNMSNVARHPSSSTKLTFYKYCDNPSEVMLNNDHPKDNFSTTKASSFVNVTKKRKVNEKLDARKDQNFDDIQTASTNGIKNKNTSSNFCSRNENSYDNSVINGGSFGKLPYFNSYPIYKVASDQARFDKGK